MSKLILDKLQEGDNYRIVEFMHQALNGLLRVAIINEKEYSKYSREMIAFAQHVYMKYLDIMGPISEQYKPNLN